MPDSIALKALGLFSEVELITSDGEEFENGDSTGVGYSLVGEVEIGLISTNLNKCFEQRHKKFGYLPYCALPLPELRKGCLALAHQPRIGGKELVYGFH